MAKTALERAAARWGTAAVLEGGEGAAAVAPEAAAGAAGATVALPVALGVYVVVAIGSLWDWGQFQAELQQQGYVILPSPLAVCIANCHQPAAPTYRPSPWPFKEPTPRPLWPGSLSDADRRAIEEWLRPEAATPTPAPSPPPVPSAVPAPQPGPRRHPGQTCDDPVLDRLQAEKDRICNSIPDESCSPSKVSQKRLDRRPCSQIRLRIQALRDCIAIRDKIQIDCFGGRPDPVHQNVIRELTSGLNACLALEAVNCAPGHPMAGL